MMKKRRTSNTLAKLLGAVLLLVAFIGGAAWFFQTHDIAVLSPKGEIATKQFHLIVFATLLSLIVIVPVFVMTYVIVRNYRVRADGKTRKPARYTPEWDHNHKLEALWWGLPTLLIIILSGVIIQSSYALDPFKPLAANATTTPITVQVVALQWKWLFIYPDQNIATVNYLEFPANRPVNFEITSDGPMNSFWIPKLGGQIYAMSGMSTGLHLLASEAGDYRGVSANLSGSGFAGMNFRVRATPQDEFDSWIHNVQRTGDALTPYSYATLAKPSQNAQPAFYNLADQSLYDTVVMKYMAPNQHQNTTYTNTLPIDQDAAHHSAMPAMHTNGSAGYTLEAR